jgi:hypothetical protein
LFEIHHHYDFQLSITLVSLPGIGDVPLAIIALQLII